MTRYYAVQEIDTDYYSQTGDDDIFTPELFKAIDFLDKNSDFNYVQGSTVQVYLDDKMNIIKTGDTWWRHVIMMIHLIEFLTMLISRDVLCWCK